MLFPAIESPPDGYEIPNELQMCVRGLAQGAILTQIALVARKTLSWSPDIRI
jgi:hypothetical protein